MFSTNQSFACYAQSAVGEEFHHLHSQALRRKRWAALTGHRHNLLSLHETAQQTKVQTRSHAGLQLVPIAKIRGSEGRCDDFDADFRPLKSHNRDRWVSVAQARSRDVALPPVELVQVNDAYFVRDGHHRISVAKLAGQLEIEAEVTVWHGVEVAVDGHVKAPVLHKTQHPTFKERLLINVGKWLVSIGVQLQARGGIAASAPALQSN